jgi:hypothetical protein
VDGGGRVCVCDVYMCLCFFFIIFFVFSFFPGFKYLNVPEATNTALQTRSSEKATAGFIHQKFALKSQICSSVYVFFYYLFICLFVYLFIYLFVRLGFIEICTVCVCMCVCVCVFMYICLLFSFISLFTTCIC